MSIRLKIILVVIPLLIASVVLAGMSSYFMAASSVTRIAVNFLDFKAEELEKYSDSQWNLLVDNGFVGRADMEQAAKAAVESFAQSILRSPTETILALDTAGAVAIHAGPGMPTDSERPTLLALAKKTGRGFIHIRLGGVERVASTFAFAPFGWQVLVTEEQAVFYGEVETIARTALYILAGAALTGIILLFLLAGYLTKPIEKVVEVMRNIIGSNNLKERVPVMYRDEIGQLSHTFNLMLEELENANDQIKQYAFDAVVAQKREMKIRNIFQLYVPKDVIEAVFVNPEKMLIGNNRSVSILFSDIRSFTTISEGMTPDALVNSLNRYFGIMVDVIMEHEGMVDKYIGDAIMAVFGAPVSHDNDALSSVIAGMKIADALALFNREQISLFAPEFHI
jgi:HAMP domain-containing protein